MRDLKIKKLMTAVALTACMTGYVGAAFAASPKTESVITHDRITLGDVFDGITENADYYLAPAPALGKTTTLNANDLTRISEAFNLGWTPDNNLRHVVIRRSSGEVDRFDIQAALQKELAAELKGQKFDMELLDRSISFRIPEDADRTVLVEGLKYDIAKGTFRAAVSVAKTKKEVSGRVYPISRIPVLSAPKSPGDVIAASDIDYIEMRAPDITSSMMTDAARLIGQTPRRGIAALKPVTASDVRMPMIVKKGDLVTMVLKSSAISLTAQGRAMDNGAEGEAIRVMNNSSKQVVDAIVTGAQTVSIKPPSMNTL